MTANEIDPRFFIPPNVTGVAYKGPETMTSSAPVQNQQEVEVTVESGTASEPSAIEDENRLLPPDSITIVSQTTRVTSGGTVVDVVIDIDEVQRISQYDVRLTK